MGRPKKIVAPPNAKPTKSATGLHQQLAAVRIEVQRIHLEDSPKAVATALRLAELQVRAWDLEGLLATDVNVRLACARQSASWAEQQIRAAKAMSVDLLRDLFAKAEQMQRHQGALKDLK